MTARLWYLRRGIMWLPVLGGCVATLVVAAVALRWPGQVGVFAPLALACCAAAAAFVFDEDGLPVVAVTPRGARWRRLSRLLVAMIPLSTWGALVWLCSSRVPLGRPGWWLIGAAVVVLSAGLAAFASRRQVAAPGLLLAPAIVLAVIAPVMMSGAFTWGSLYPVGDFPDSVRTLWLTVLGVGLVACIAGLRPGLRW